MKLNKFSLYIMLFLLILAPFSQAQSEKLDEILAQYPAERSQDLAKLNHQLIELGSRGIQQLCAKVLPLSETGDANARFAVSGLTKHEPLLNNESQRKMVVNAFLAAIDSADHDQVKEFIIDQIQYIGNQEAIAPLSHYLTHDALFEQTVQTLVTIGNAEASAAIMFALPQANDQQLPTFIKALGELQSRAAAIALLPYAESEDLETRLMTYFALANIGDLSAEPVLKRAMTRTSGAEQAEAINANFLFAKRLTETHATNKALSIYETLINTFTTANDVHIQCQALTGVVSIEGENALDALLAAMDSPYKRYRNVALTLAQSLGDQSTTWQWIEKAQTASPEVQAEIFAFLAQRGDDIALPTLLSALDSDDESVQNAAILGAYELGELESVPSMIPLLKLASGTPVGTVKTILLQTPSHYLLPLINSVLDEVSITAQIALLDIIAQREAQSFFDQAASFASHDNADVRMAAIRCLQALDSTETLPQLIAILNQVDGREADAMENAIFAAINNFSEPYQKIEALKDAFNESPKSKKSHLINLLQRVDHEECLPLLTHYLDVDGLQQEAAQAIVAIVCPSENEAYGLHSRQAHHSLKKSIKFLEDDDLIEQAKAHLPAEQPEADEDGFVSLFNGENFDGWLWANSWKGEESGYFVKDEMITCAPDGGGNIYTDRQYSDFVVQFEFKLPPGGNNGLGIRCPLRGDAAYSGMELQILDHDDPQYANIRPYQAHGSVYGIIPAKRGFLKPDNEWNKQTVIADGRSIKIILNGHVIVDEHLDYARMPKTIDGNNHPGAARPAGHIGFLGHGYAVSFKNIKIKDLNTEPRPDNTPPEGFTALFNGEDLTNWKGLVANPVKRAQMSEDELAEAQKQADQRMRDHWKVEDGVLVFDGKGQSLCTIKDYGNFEFLVDWKIKERGDSGIYLRGTPQVQIWDAEYENIGSGGLYNNQKNPSQPTTIADNPVGEWNTFRIIMVGENVTIYLNDVLVVDNVVLENYWERNKPIYPTGQIELQNHGNTLYFKNVYIRELPEK